MSLFEFLRLIYRNGRIIVISVVTLLISTYLFTKTLKREYVSEAVIYTGIASGFNIESGSDAKIDYHSINNAFDNLMSIIKSRVTLEEVSLRLLAKHLMLDEPNKQVLGADGFNFLKETVPPAFLTKVKDSTEEATFNNIQVLYENYNPFLHDLVSKSSSIYAIKKLKEISAKRNKSSDMVELAFVSNDPAVAKSTLDLMLFVFSNRYKNMKESETGDVVAYFEEELRKVKSDLDKAEDKLTDFRVNSRIINYVEQTKAVAFKKQNALEEYAMKKMNLKATASALKEIESKLAIREDILSKNAELLRKKNRLSELTSILAYAQANADSTTNVQTLNDEQEKLKRGIKADLETLFNFSNTKEGLPSKQLLNDWLNNVIQLNKEQVTVDLYMSRLNEIDAEYDRFAPMGSTIARLERQIDVSEREYLEVLHGLNVAKLRQQNIQMSSKLEVVDQPKFPLEPLASKKAMMMVVALLIGLMFPITVFLTIELLDNSLKSPERAQAISNIKVAGAIPVVDKNLKRHEGALQLAVGQIINKIRLNLPLEGNKKPVTIVGISTTQGQGKTFALRQIFEELKSQKIKVCFIHPAAKDQKDTNVVDEFSYEITNELVKVKSVAKLVEAEDLTDYDVLLCELPAWIESKTPLKLLTKADLMLWIADASKTWSLSQKTMLADIISATGQEPKLILNGVKTHLLDQVIGEVPTKRSFVTKWFRRVAKFEFNSSSFNKG
ncbi:MAG: GNVR domain-containing protein [Cyclobacteriaceae bacterium]